MRRRLTESIDALASSITKGVAYQHAMVNRQLDVLYDKNVQRVVLRRFTEQGAAETFLKPQDVVAARRTGDVPADRRRRAWPSWATRASSSTGRTASATTCTRRRRLACVGRAAFFTGPWARGAVGLMDYACLFVIFLVSTTPRRLLCCYGARTVGGAHTPWPKKASSGCKTLGSKAQAARTAAAQTHKSL